MNTLRRRPSRRWAVWLWALTVVGIIYGSLYPFDFDWQAVSVQTAFAELSIDGRVHWSVGNVLANVVLFVPFGLFGMLALVRLRPVARWLLLMGGGVVLAFPLQVAQLWLALRVPDFADGVINMFGLVIGAVLALIPWFRLQRDAHGANDATLMIPAMLIACWVAYKWFPFVPTLDWYTIKQGVKPLLLEPRLEWLAVLRNLVGWLVLAVLWRDCRLREGWFWAFLPVVVLAQAGIAHNPLALDSVLGAALALPLWWLLSRLTLVPAAQVCLLLMLLVVVQGMHPFALGSSTFHWVPFQGFLTGNMMANLGSLLFKLFLYGSLVWLVFHTTWRLPVALIVPTVWVLLVEIAQTQIAGRVAEITDPLLCVLIWSVLWIVRQSQQRTGALPRLGPHKALGPPARSPLTSRCGGDDSDYNGRSE